MLAVLDEGLGQYEPPMPQETRDEFVQRMARWLPNAVKEDLREDQVAAICDGLRGIATERILLPWPPTCDERLWLLEGVCRTQTAVQRYVQFSAQVTYAQAHEDRLAEIGEVLAEALAQRRAPPAAQQQAAERLSEALRVLRGAPLWTPFAGGVEGDELVWVVRQRLESLPDVRPHVRGAEAWARWAVRLAGYDVQSWFGREVGRPRVRSVDAEEFRSALLDMPPEGRLAFVRAFRADLAGKGGPNWEDDYVSQRAGEVQREWRDACLFLVRPLFPPPIAGHLAPTSAAAEVPTPRGEGCAEVTFHRPPSDARALLGMEGYGGTAPYVLTVQYVWGPGQYRAVHFVSSVCRAAGPWATDLPPAGMHVDGDRLRRRAPVLWPAPGPATASVPLDQVAQEWPDLLLSSPPGSGYTTVDFYLAQLALLTDPARVTVEDLGVVDLQGRRTRQLRLTPHQPLLLYEPHRLTAFLLWRDEERNVVLRWEGQTADGKTAVVGTVGDLLEAPPGRWVPLLREEAWEPGTYAQPVERNTILGDQTVTQQETARYEVGGYTEITQLCVVADGVVLPKDIGHLDDRGELLMHMRFLSYEIEYDDATVVYAEPD